MLSYLCARLIFKRQKLASVWRVGPFIAFQLAPYQNLKRDTSIYAPSTPYEIFSL